MIAPPPIINVRRFFFFFLISNFFLQRLSDFAHYDKWQIWQSMTNDSFLKRDRLHSVSLNWTILLLWILLLLLFLGGNILLWNINTQCGREKWDVLGLRGRNTDRYPLTHHTGRDWVLGSANKVEKSHILENISFFLFHILVLAL